MRLQKIIAEGQPQKRQKPATFRQFWTADYRDYLFPDPPAFNGKEHHFSGLSHRPKEGALGASKRISAGRLMIGNRPTI